MKHVFYQPIAVQNKQRLLQNEHFNKLAKRSHDVSQLINRAKNKNIFIIKLNPQYSLWRYANNHTQPSIFSHPFM